MKELVRSISEDTIFLDVVAKNQQEALTFLANQLVRQGAVKASYPEAIVQREVEFPTGLQTKDGGIALPHTDPKHVNRQTVAIGVLQESLIFQAMGPDQTVEVGILFMLAMKDSRSQILMLQELAAIFQQEGLLQQIKQAGSADEVIQMIQDA